MEEYREKPKEQIDDFSKQHRLSPEFKRKKFLIWTVRTGLSAILYIIFWKYEWVRWTLVAYIPLALFNLVMIFGFNFILDRRVKKIRSKVNR